MTSVPAFLKQIPTDARNFVPVSSLVYNNPAVGICGIAALNATTGALTAASWVGTAAPGGGNKYTSSINGPGAGKLRDMGRTYVSAGRVFRKVQLIVPNTQVTSTFGVEGQVNTTPTTDYLTGYIELGWEGAGWPAPVVRAP